MLGYQQHMINDYKKLSREQLDDKQVKKIITIIDKDFTP